VQIVSRVAQALQGVFHEDAVAAAEETGVIRRLRKFNPVTLAGTFVLGLLARPSANPKELAVMAARLGVDVTPQAVQQRMNSFLAAFLFALIQRVMRRKLAATPVSVELLQRFNGVFLNDSTTLQLPDEYAAEWPGCGGREGFGKAAMKIQVSIDWLTGGLNQVHLEPARNSDQASVLQRQTYPPGSLRIADLGYFCLTTLADIASSGSYFISRIQPHTQIYDAAGQPLKVLSLLKKEWRGEPLDLQILLGKEARLPCRLIAVRAPSSVVAKRRKRLRADAKRRKRTVSAARLEWCQWTIYVTNAEPERLAWNEIAVLYHLRWQIELLFKLWKSEGKLAELGKHSPEEKLARLYARILAMILQHWLLLSSVWHLPDRSLTKAAQRIREFVTCLAGSLDDLPRLIQELTSLQSILKKVAKLDRRLQKPNHHQLLENPSLLKYT